MTGNDLDSNPTAGTEAAPPADGSQGTGDSKGSFDATKLQTAIEAMARKLEEVDARSRALQSDKDRGVTKATKELADLKRQFAEIEKLKGSGLELDDAVEEFDFRETVRQLKDQIGKLNPASPQTAGNGASGAVDVAQVLQQYQLDPKDAYVASQMQGKTFANQTDAELFAARVFRDKTLSPNPNPAQAPSTPASSAGGNNAESLISRLQDLQKFPTKNKAEINELYKTLEARGWQ